MKALEKIITVIAAGLFAASLIIVASPAAAQSATSPYGDIDSLKSAGLVSVGDCLPIKASWDAPVDRFDGSVLPASELQGYVLSVVKNNEVQPAINITGAEFIAYLIRPASCAAGDEYQISVAAVDVDNQVSDFESGPAVVHSGKLVGKSRPSKVTGFSAGLVE